MKEHNIGIIMNGVTGRMGTNQHLIRSILAIREQGDQHAVAQARLAEDTGVQEGAQLQHTLAQGQGR